MLGGRRLPGFAALSVDGRRDRGGAQERTETRRRPHRNAPQGAQERETGNGRTARQGATVRDAVTALRRVYGRGGGCAHGRGDRSGGAVAEVRGLSVDGRRDATAAARVDGARG